MKAHFKLGAGRYRSGDFRRCLQCIETLPQDRPFVVEIELWSESLAANLQARLHIIMREIANYCGYTEDEFKWVIAKSKFYPKYEKALNTGEVVSLPKSTMKLTNAEAREVEIHLIEYANVLGVKLQPFPPQDETQ